MERPHQFQPFGRRHRKPVEGVQAAVGNQQCRGDIRVGQVADFIDQLARVGIEQQVSRFFRRRNLQRAVHDVRSLGCHRVCSGFTLDA